MKVNALSNLKQPQFITGLKHAKRILLEVRAEKLRENIGKNDKSKPQGETKVKCEDLIIQDLRSEEKKSPMKMNYQKTSNENKGEEKIKVITRQNIKNQLSEKINEIGKDLQQTNQQNQALEVIFNRMVEYYSENKKIVSENDELKKQIFENREEVDHLQSKILNSYKQIEVIESQNVRFCTLAKEKIHDYLKEQEECNIFEVYKQDSHNFQQEFQQMQQNIDSKEKLIDHQQESDDSQIHLNYRALREQNLARKQVQKKPKNSSFEESSMDKFYAYDL